MRAAIWVGNGERILGVATQLGFRQQLSPSYSGALQFFGRERVAGGASFDRAMRGEISAEKTRVRDDAANNSWQAEADDAPVVAGCASAARLPAVHPFAAISVLVFDENWLRVFE